MQPGEAKGSGETAPTDGVQQSLQDRLLVLLALFQNRVFLLVQFSV